MLDPDSKQRDESENGQRSWLVTFVSRLNAKFPAWPWLSVPALLAFSLSHGERVYDHVILFVGFGFVALVGGVALKVAAKLTYKLEVPLKMAFEALLVSLAVCWALSRAYANALENSAGVRLANLLALFLVNASILALIIRTPSSAPLGFWRACVLTILIVVGLIVFRLALGGLTGLLDLLR
jgi:hypothetical protein